VPVKSMQSMQKERILGGYKHHALQLGCACEKHAIDAKREDLRRSQTPRAAAGVCL